MYVYENAEPVPYFHLIQVHILKNKIRSFIFSLDPEQKSVKHQTHNADERMDFDPAIFLKKDWFKGHKHDSLEPFEIILCVK
jgi:hypothetical protein